MTTFEPAGTSAVPPSVLRGEGGASCILAKPLPPGLFVDGDAQSTPGLDDRLTFVYEAGDAVRAELELSTGATLPVAVQDGWLGGWFSRDQVPLGVDATVVAFGADGAELGRFPVVDQRGCIDPAGC
jgi:hypothetical protein